MTEAANPRTAPRSAHTPSSSGVAAFAGLWIGGSVLAGGALALLATVAPLPVADAAVLHWLEDNRFALTWAGELLFFAVVSWGTGAAGVFGRYVDGAVVRRTLALVALAVALVAFVIVLLALGRLVYPVSDRALAAEAVSLLGSVVVGAVHLALLALAIVAVALPIPMRSRRSRRLAVALGIVWGALLLGGSFPWLLPMWVNVAVAVAVGCGGALSGVAVLRRQRAHRQHPHPQP